MSSSYRLELDRWLADLEVKADTVFDIGGSQLPLKGRTKSWDVKDYKILDLAEPHKDSPKPDVVFNLEQSNDFTGKADLVFCLEVFDYIIKPHMAMLNIADCLKDDGTAWVTYPSFYPLHQPIEDDAFRYMPGAIARLATNAGLKVESIIYRRPETNLLQQFYSAERMRAAKRVDHNFTGMIVEFKK